MAAMRCASSAETPCFTGGTDLAPVHRRAPLSGARFVHPRGRRVSKLLLVFVVSVIAAVVAAVLAHGRRTRRRSTALPPLVFDVHDTEERDLRPATFPAPRAGDRGGAPRQWPTPGRPSGETRQVPRPAGQNGVSPSDATSHASSVRAAYFPGTLEIQSASHRGELIRFPRSHSGRAWFTLGREAGDPASHIVIPADTVSGRHARLEFHDGRWRITNLSRSNPTAVNGTLLTDESGGRWLADGDQIMMGELLLVYRA